MALGWCPTCDTLRSIRPGPQKWGSRARDWYPVPHDVYRHACGAIVDDDTCRACGPVYASEVFIEPCAGDKCAIK